MQSAEGLTADSQTSLPAPTNHTTLLTLVWLKGNRSNMMLGKSSRTCSVTHMGPMDQGRRLGRCRTAWAYFYPKGLRP